MNDKLVGRLLNWKFNQAMGYLDGEPDTVRVVVTALSSIYGDCGWFWGYAAVIIAAALESIGITGEEE